VVVLAPAAGRPERRRRVYVTTRRDGGGVTARTSVALTRTGRAALERYTVVLRQPLDSASQHQVPDAVPDALP